ncbi:MAG: hypothetical protein ACF787_01760, partial [Rhodopirellula sp. JB053]
MRKRNCLSVRLGMTTRGRARRSTIVVVGFWLAGLIFIGCDVPDRHDIAMFRKPAVWEVEPPTDPTADVVIKPASLVPANSHAESAQQDWQFWYLHHVDSEGVIGGGVMQSQRMDS